jgi:cellulose synthase/poly-beta-1,6-N-acetylglucosamine synthase-like glycosyltransferase
VKGLAGTSRLFPDFGRYSMPKPFRPYLPRRLKRPMELATGLVTCIVLTAPFWAALLGLSPVIAVIILLFDAFWVYRSVALAMYSLLGFKKLQQWQKVDWWSEARKLKDHDKVHHLVVVPICGEPPELVAETLEFLVTQTVPTDQLSVMLAFEERIPRAPHQARWLLSRYSGCFAHLWVSFHPELPGEVRGKAANVSYAVKQAFTKLAHYLEKKPTQVIVTVCDADSRLHPQYLAAVTAQYLRDPEGPWRMYQPAILFYANIWRLNPVFQVINALHSVWHLAKLVAQYKLITFSTYSLSLELVHRVGYWDADVIPEDSHMFFKAFYSQGGKVRVVPIYLPVYADAAESSSPWRTAVNQYRQERRWSWGVTDVPYVLFNALRAGHIPLSRRLHLGLRYLQEHLAWPTHWFILAFWPALLLWLDPAFAATPWGEALPKWSSLLLDLSIPFAIVLVLVDMKLRPQPQHPLGLLQRILCVVSWGLLPVLSLLLSVLPAVEAHIRAFLGLRLEYWVTEKVTAPTENKVYLLRTDK